MNRTIECVNQHGDASDSGLCPSAAPADQLQCNVLPCDFCSTTTCNNQVPFATLASITSPKF